MNLDSIFNDGDAWNLMIPALSTRVLELGCMAFEIYILFAPNLWDYEEEDARFVVWLLGMALHSFILICFVKRISYETLNWMGMFMDVWFMCGAWLCLFGHAPYYVRVDLFARMINAIVKSYLMEAIIILLMKKIENTTHNDSAPR